MHIVGTDKLEEFRERHSDARSWVVNWLHDAKGSEWKRPKDIKDKYPSASILRDNVVIFDVKGNKYRLGVQIDYISNIILILFVGTHDEYERWNRQRR